MTLIQFINIKNKIIRQETGLTLIPQDQIIDIEPEEIGQLHTHTDSGCSPYCVFNVIYDDGFEDCSKCPLEKAGNGCSEDNSTYQSIYHSLKVQGRRIHELSAIQALVEQWNRDINHEHKKRKNHAKNDWEYWESNNA